MTDLNQVFKTSLCYLHEVLGYKAFGKLHRDGFLSVFAPKVFVLSLFTKEMGLITCSVSVDSDLGC